jgi:hypothetical protein
MNFQREKTGEKSTKTPSEKISNLYLVSFVLYNRNTWQKFFILSASKTDAMNIDFLPGFLFNSDELSHNSVSPFSRLIIRQI